MCWLCDTTLLINVKHVLIYFNLMLCLSFVVFDKSLLNYLAAELVVVADKYDIDNLKLICEEKRVLQIWAENCIILLKLADIRYWLHQLEQKLIPFIKENIDKIEESVFDDLSKSHPNLVLKLFNKFVYNKTMKRKWKFFVILG